MCSLVISLFCSHDLLVTSLNIITIGIKMTKCELTLLRSCLQTTGVVLKGATLPYRHLVIHRKQRDIRKLINALSSEELTHNILCTVCHSN